MVGLRAGFVDFRVSDVAVCYEAERIRLTRTYANTFLLELC